MIALYCRLSVADGDGGESDSIANQRLILTDFIASRDDLKGEEHRFFVDDGISGTHAENRPALQEMLRCCREGRVSTVVVKDLSRLSRDSLYCIALVEDELPSLGVRVIAVVDNYDSRRDGKSTSTGMQLGFKAIMNSWYSKDLSRKVTQGIRSEHARGMNLRTVPFGYRKREGEYTCTADEKGAPVVRRIFELALDGLNQAEIASKLNEEGAITPHNLKVLRSKGGRWEAKPNQRWTGTMVKRIVRNPHYKGTLVLGKTRRNEIGLCAARKTAPEERFVFENAHEAIVSEGDWTRAQGSMADTNRGGTVEPLGHLFAGFVFCPHCGKAVSFRAGRRPGLACYTAYCGCFREAPSIALHDLEEAVASVVRTHVELLFGLSDAIETAKASPKRIAGLRSSLRRLSARKMRAYEEYRTGERSPEEFAALKAAMDTEGKSVRHEIERMEAAAERKASAFIDAERAFEIARRLGGRELCRETLEALVDRIELLGDDEVRITLKYADVFERLG